MSIGEALKICGFSIATVFVVLFCIELLIKIFAWAIERKTEKANKDAAINLIKNGASLDLISKSLGYTIEELEKMQQEIK